MMTKIHGLIAVLILLLVIGCGSTTQQVDQTATTIVLPTLTVAAQRAPTPTSVQLATEVTPSVPTDIGLQPTAVPTIEPTAAQVTTQLPRLVMADAVW